MSGITKLMIEQQFAQVGIRTTNAQLHISTPRPQMTIENVAPEMNVDRKAPTFEVDWDAVYNESGLRRPGNFAKHVTAKAAKTGMESIGEAVREGDLLGDVARGGDRVVEIAKNQTRKATQTEINLGLMPHNRPSVQWDPGYVNVSWSRHQLIVEWDTEFMPEFKVDPPYSVEIFLRNRPYIKITVAEGEDPYQPGKVVDESL